MDSVFPPQHPQASSTGPQDPGFAARQALLMEQLHAVAALARQLHGSVRAQFPEAAAELDARQRAADPLGMTTPEKLAIVDEQRQALQMATFRHAPEAAIEMMEPQLSTHESSRTIVAGLIARLRVR